MKQLLSTRKYRVRALLIIMFVALGLFWKLVLEIFSEDHLALKDQSVVKAISLYRTPFLTNFFTFITNLGNVVSVIIIVLVVLFLLIRFAKGKFALTFFLTTVFSIGFTFLAKIIFARERPVIANALVIESSFSFPSGHALLAISVYGLITFILVKLVKNNFWRLIILFVGVLLIVLIGFSRIYLGVHWPTDVIASYAIGLAWLAFTLLALEYKPEIVKYLKQLFQYYKKR